MKTINKILLLLFLVCFVSCEIEPELIYEAKIADVNVNALEVTAEFDGPHGSYDYYDIKFFVTYNFLVREHSHSVSLRVKYGTKSEVEGESLFCESKEIAIGDPLDGFYSGEVVETIREHGSDYSDGLYYQVVLVCKVLSANNFASYEYDELVISSSEVKKLELQ